MWPQAKGHWCHQELEEAGRVLPGDPGGGLRPWPQTSVPRWLSEATPCVWPFVVEPPETRTSLGLLGVGGGPHFYITFLRRGDPQRREATVSRQGQEPR